MNPVPAPAHPACAPQGADPAPGPRRRRPPAACAEPDGRVAPRSARIMVAGEAAAFGERLSRSLAAVGMEVDCPGGYAAAVRAALDTPYPLAVVNFDSPVGGSIFLRSLRMVRPGIAAIVVSRRHDVGAKLTAFEAGACDYVVVPFSLAELVARIHVHMRPAPPDPYVIAADGVVLDVMRREVRIRGRTVHLADREALILGRLLQTPGRVVRRDELASFVWQCDAQPNTLDATVGRLRRKLGPGARIVTIRGVGHHLEIGGTDARRHRPAPVRRARAGGRATGTEAAGV
jgi:DNA-binding response OmpR family regulator